MKFLLLLLKRFLRTMLIVLLVAIGSTFLVRSAPGYLSDVREMDSRYRESAQLKLSAEAARSTSLRQMLITQFRGWARGDLGVSRQYEVPVLELILPRLAVTGSLMLWATLLAWTLAGVASLLSSIARNPSLAWQAPVSLLLAVPTSAMATTCLLAGGGGPLLVMTLLIASRDFKFLDRIFRKAWREPHLLLARAQGIKTSRLLWSHILPSITSDLLAVTTLSIVTGLSALVPVEVIFGVPGIGQLAWSAAINRDLPILLAVTMLMAVAVSFASLLSGRRTEWGAT